MATVIELRPVAAQYKVPVGNGANYIATIGSAVVDPTPAELRQLRCFIEYVCATRFRDAGGEAIAAAPMPIAEGAHKTIVFHKRACDSWAYRGSTWPSASPGLDGYPVPLDRLLDHLNTTDEHRSPRWDQWKRDHTEVFAPLAHKLQHLRRTVHPHGPKPYSLAEIVDGIEQAGGPRVSREYIHLLITGQRGNPSMKLLEAIAAFFKVSPAYFFDDQEGQRSEPALEASTLRYDRGALRIAVRATGLTPASQQVAEEVLTHLRELEGLDPAPEQDE